MRKLPLPSNALLKLKRCWKKSTASRVPRDELDFVCGQISHSLGITADDGNKITIREGETFMFIFLDFILAKRDGKAGEHDPDRSMLDQVRV